MRLHRIGYWSLKLLQECNITLQILNVKLSSRIDTRVHIKMRIFWRYIRIESFIKYFNDFLARLKWNVHKMINYTSFIKKNVGFKKKYYFFILICFSYRIMYNIPHFTKLGQNKIKYKSSILQILFHGKTLYCHQIYLYLHFGYIEN